MPGFAFVLAATRTLLPVPLWKAINTFFFVIGQVYLFLFANARPCHVLGFIHFPLASSPGHGAQTATKPPLPSSSSPRAPWIFWGWEMGRPAGGGETHKKKKRERDATGREDDVQERWLGFAPMGVLRGAGLGPRGCPRFPGSAQGAPKPAHHRHLDVVHPVR